MFLASKSGNGEANKETYQSLTQHRAQWNITNPVFWANSPFNEFMLSQPLTDTNIYETYGQKRQLSVGTS